MPILPAEAYVHQGRDNSGAAYVIPSSHEDVMDYWLRLQNTQRLRGGRGNAADVSFLNKIKPWAVDVPYFDKKREEYINTVGDAIKGNYTQDPEFQRKKELMKDQIIAEAQVSNYQGTLHKDESGKYYTNPELFPDESTEQLDEYAYGYKAPLERPSEFNLRQFDDADYNKYIEQRTVPQSKGGGYMLNPDGTKTTWRGNKFDEADSMRMANMYFNDSDNKYTRALKKHLRGAIAEVNPEFENLPKDIKEKVLKSAFQDYWVNAQRVKFTPEYSTNIAKAPKEGATGFGAGGGSNERWAVTKVPEGTIREKSEEQKYYEGGIEFPGSEIDFAGGFDLKDLTAAENAPQFWKSGTHYVRNDKGDFVKKGNFNQKGSVVGIYPIGKKIGAEDKWMAAIQVPPHKETVERQGAFGKVKEEVEIPQQTVYIPYDGQVSSIEAYTADKQGLNGFVVPGFERTGKSEEKKTETKTTTKKIKASRNYLKQKGYSDKQIDAAVKSGKLELE